MGKPLKVLTSPAFKKLTSEAPHTHRWKTCHTSFRNSVCWTIARRMQTTLATLQPETPFPGVLYLVALWRRRLAKKGKEIRRSAIEEVERSPKQSWNWRGKLLEDFLRDNLEFWKSGRTKKKKRYRVKFFSPKWLLQNLPVNSLGVNLKKKFCAIPCFCFFFGLATFFKRQNVQRSI